MDVVAPRDENKQLILLLGILVEVKALRFDLRTTECSEIEEKLDAITELLTDMARQRASFAHQPTQQKECIPNQKYYQL
jgi:hypothetical protein